MPFKLACFHSQIKIILFVIFLIFLNTKPFELSAQTRQSSPEAFLKGRTDVDLQIVVTARPENRCGLTDAAVRSAAVQVFAPAGLKIDQAAQWTIQISVVTVKTGAGVCASAISARNTVYGKFNAQSGGDFIDSFLFGIIGFDARINTSGEGDHLLRVQNEIRSISQEMLAVWMEQNSGTRLVTGGLKQPITTADDVRMAQRVLQRLGLYSGQIDGSIGPGTRNGLVEFQRQNAISPTGELNEPTLLLLRARQQ